MKEKTKQEIEKLIDYWKNKGWQCKTEVPTIYKKNNNGIKGLSVNRIDACCDDPISKSLKCWEYEDNTQFQAVKNFRAGNNFINEMKQQGIYDNADFCQLSPEENFLEVCENFSQKEEMPINKLPANKPFTQKPFVNNLIPKKKIYVSW
jgi:hypothetical protein